MTLPLVVGTDGSDAALKAVDWAADEAAVRGVPLRIVYASLWERYEDGHPPSPGKLLKGRSSPSTSRAPRRSGPACGSRALR